MVCERNFIVCVCMWCVCDLCLRHRVSVEVSVLLELEDTSVFLAVRMSKGGCGVATATGVFLWLDSRGFYNITTDLGQHLVIHPVHGTYIA